MQLLSHSAWQGQLLLAGMSFGMWDAEFSHVHPDSLCVEFCDPVCSGTDCCMKSHMTSRPASQVHMWSFVAGDQWIITQVIAQSDEASAGA